MIAVVQRVSKAGVTVAEAGHDARIELGLVVLLCIEHEDTPEKASWMAAKIAKLRVFEDDDQRFNLSIKDVAGSVLLVSQFTLAGDCSKGNRPSFISAASPEAGQDLIDKVQQLLHQEHDIPVECGVFGASMKVDLVNEGPATFILRR
ncbi:MAG: D-tyrosyl-tRNA(Tyr) deacylase [Phycisphaerae bacterium]|nr:D-tyrosyl-tRNA(Tyr) deacylase [Phycisphaerae bacterium]|tara:strand:+ start:7603 stop:8046 length:444 start_codon:yes stop_codon:yes gene_type:complete